MQAILSIPSLQHKDLPIPFQQMHELIFEDQQIHKSLRLATQEAFTNMNVMLNNKLVLGEQEDCHEFLSTFFGLPESKSLHPYFKTTSVQIVKCTNPTCSYESTKEISSLQLLIQPNIDIQEAITNGLLVSEQRKYTCSSCATPYCKFSSFVTSPPPVLMVFTSLFESLSNYKVKYDWGYKSYEEFINFPAITSEEINRYAISSLITHTGREIHSGHYKAYVRHGDGWLCCNDSLVKKITEPIFDANEHVYVQFYKRLN